MENKINDKEVIDLREVFKKLLSRKKLFIRNAIIAFVLSAAWILPQPRIYTTEVTLAPEMENIAGGGGLMDIAASFGFDLGSASVSDAIYPTLYPDLMESSNFIVSLFDIKVKNEDGDIETDYYTYLLKHQKGNIYTWPFRWVKKQVKSLIPSKKKPIISDGKGGDGKPNPFCLSEEQDMIVEKIRNSIKCDVDIKTNVITINVDDQDRLICACIADSVRERLQQYITNYRTNKSRVDVEYYARLMNEAKQKYTRTRQAYTTFADANTDIQLASFRAKQEDMENEMQLQYNAYTTFETQYQTALAKLQERTPSFTTIQCASIPQKPVRPKRMFFVLGIMFLAIIGTGVWIFKDAITQQLLASSKDK